MIPIRYDPTVPDQVRRGHRYIRNIFVVMMIIDVILVITLFLLGSPFFIQLLIAFVTGVIGGCLGWFIFIAAVRRRAPALLDRVLDDDDDDE